MNLKEAYDRIAEDWHKDHQNDDWWREGVDHLISLLPPAASMLDVGCGGGVKARYLTGRGFKVTGVDISTGLLEIARREVPGAEFKELSMYDLDTLTESYDCVFAQASLLHIPKADAAMVVGKMAARLAPNGYLYLAVKEMREGGPAEEVLKEDDYGYEYERFFSYFTLAELESYAKAAGLEVVWSSRTMPGTHTVWLQVVAKKA